MSFESGSSLTLFALAIAGCSTANLVGDAYEGWSMATVTDIVTFDQNDTAATRDCRMEIDPVTAANRSFARVLYSRARNVRSAIVLVDDAGLVHPGDRVYVMASDCTRPLRTK